MLHIFQQMNKIQFGQFLGAQSARMGFAKQADVIRLFRLDKKQSGSISRIYSGTHIPGADFFRQWLTDLCLSEAEKIRFLEAWARYNVAMIDDLRAENIHYTDDAAPFGIEPHTFRNLLTLVNESPKIAHGVFELINAIIEDSVDASQHQLAADEKSEYLVPKPHNDKNPDHK